MSGLHFELVSPVRLLFSGEVASVQLPGTEGDMGIFPGHAPVLSTLRPGVVVISREQGAAEKIFVRGGFAEVNPAGLTVLAETAIPLAELDAAALAGQVKDAEEDVADAKDAETRRRASENLEHLKDLQRSM
ncbi:MAG: F0F1 ATP synthase subunit epsilon [Rhizobiales bacterium]|nr:F0F1 ATP synthase subunit epsilon [Hyphomicrobiales bacterium]MBI3673564.1 F0F1 ATP synthase subunit epsilon [Hyphomicrobiales bacterium]